MTPKAPKNLNVLFLCTGNTCRSPMAKVIFEDLLSRREQRHLLKADSAGIVASTGLPASRYAVEVCREHGLDLSRHQSKPVTEKLLAAADLVLVMQPSHRLFLDQYSGLPKEKASLLGQFLPGISGPVDIEDPFGGDMDLYRRTYNRLEECLDGLVAFLVEKYEL